MVGKTLRCKIFRLGIFLYKIVMVVVVTVVGKTAPPSIVEIALVPGAPAIVLTPDTFRMEFVEVPFRSIAGVRKVDGEFRRAPKFWAFLLRFAH